MRRANLGMLAILIAAVAGVGWFYGAVLSQNGSGPLGAAYAFGIFAPLFLFQQGWLLPRLRDWLNGLPTIAFFVVELGAYVALIAFGCALAGTALWWAGLLGGDWADAAYLPPRVLLYSLAVSSVFVFVMRLRDLVGSDIFLSLITSRYRRPRREERVFLFVDLVGSTSFAERHGDLRAQQFLSAIYRVMAGPVRRHRGRIDDYIGDSAIISWSIDDGVRDAACVRCAFAIVEALEDRRDRWMATFGEVPRLRAALHGGPIIMAEIGVDHHKITYFGDTVNTTARLEQLCRSLEAPLLISGDLLARLALPGDIAAAEKGAFRLRGRGQDLAVAALNRLPVVQGA